jgi:hypothetical protein
MSQGESSTGKWIVFGSYFILCLYMFPANLGWYILTLAGMCEPYPNGFVEAFLCPWEPNLFLSPLSWGPFLLDAVFSGVAWLVILKVLGVKL